MSWYVADRHRSSLFVTQFTLCSEEGMLEAAPRPYSQGRLYPTSPYTPGAPAPNPKGLMRELGGSA